MYQKPLTCSEQDDYPRFTYSTFMLRKILFTSPLPLVHVQFILLVSVQINSCLSEQLLPGNWITDEEISCYPNS